MAKLPDWWREERGPATREPKVKPPRHWRTRKDRFEGVWCDVLEWLQGDHPDRFNRANLRTLQRRVQQWRGVMANKLVYAASGTALSDPVGKLEMAPAGGDPKCWSFNNISR